MKQHNPQTQQNRPSMPQQQQYQQGPQGAAQMYRAAGYAPYGVTNRDGAQANQAASGPLPARGGGYINPAFQGGYSQGAGFQQGGYPADRGNGYGSYQSGYPPQGYQQANGYGYNPQGPPRFGNLQGREGRGGGRGGRSPCRHWVGKGFCQMGASCKFAHEPGRNGTGFGPGGWWGGQNGFRGGPFRMANRNTSPCRHWNSKGYCQMGEQCNFLHDPAQRGTGPAPGSNGKSPCRHWMRLGSCNLGEKCLFGHPTGGTQKQEQQQPAQQRTGIATESSPENVIGAASKPNTEVAIRGEAVSVEEKANNRSGNGISSSPMYQSVGQSVGEGEGNSFSSGIQFNIAGTPNNAAEEGEAPGPSEKLQLEQEGEEDGEEEIYNDLDNK